MTKQAKRFAEIAFVCLFLSLACWYFWNTAPEEKALASHQTNPYAVVGVPLVAALASGVLAVLCQFRKR